MKIIHALTFDLIAQLQKNNATGQSRLDPAADMTFVFSEKVETDNSTAQDAQIVTVRTTAAQLREIADNMIFAARRIDELVGPLSTAGHVIDHDDALTLAREAHEVLTLTSAPTLRVNTAKRIKDDLAKAGWNFDALVDQFQALDAAAAGEPAPGKICRPGCPCETPPDLGPEPGTAERIAEA